MQLCGPVENPKEIKDKLLRLLVDIGKTIGTEGVAEVVETWTTLAKSCASQKSGLRKKKKRQITPSTTSSDEESDEATSDESEESESEDSDDEDDETIEEESEVDNEEINDECGEKADENMYCETTDVRPSKKKRIEHQA